MFRCSMDGRFEGTYIRTGETVSGKHEACRSHAIYSTYIVLRTVINSEVVVHLRAGHCGIIGELHNRKAPSVAYA